MSVTDIVMGTEKVDPTLLRKVEAVLRDVRPRLPQGWRIEVFETERTKERAAWLKANGYSWTTKSKHVADARGVVNAVDIVFKSPNGGWTWDAPRFVDRDGKKVGGWEIVERSKRAHGIRVIPRDKPHCELG
jgi:hypothetical protein